MNLLPQCSIASILLYVLAAETPEHLIPTHPQHCVTDKDSLFKFSVVSRKNQSGNWIAQVHFEHGSENSEPWEAEVYHVSSKCAGREKLSIQASLTSPDRGNKRRRRDYELIPDFGYYKMHLEARTWLEALETCAKEDAKLLILESESEVRGLMPFFSKHPKNLGDWRNNVFYIGIHDFFADGVYYTISGDPVASLGYNKWSSEPTVPSENCGMVLLDGTLGDANCQQHKLYFICEQKM